MKRIYYLILTFLSFYPNIYAQVDSTKQSNKLIFTGSVQSDLLFPQEDKSIGSTKSKYRVCLLYTSPSPRDLSTSRMPSSA